MRALFIVLVLGNLTLLGWILARGYFEQDQNTEISALVSPTDPGLESLGSERSTDQSEADGSSVENVAAVRSGPAQKSASATDAAGNSQSVPGKCEIIGPFVESGPGEGVLEELEAHGLAGQISELDVPAPSDYWVYYPPLSSRRAALNQLAELQKRKIDSFVITQGTLINGISLGLFTKRSSALELVTRMQALGYPAKIQEVFRSRREFWISVEYAADALSQEKLWKRLEARFPLMQRRGQQCE